MNEAIVLSPSEVLEKSMHEEHEALQKGKALPDGTIRSWGGKDYVKRAGKWALKAKRGVNQFVRGDKVKDRYGETHEVLSQTGTTVHTATGQHIHASNLTHATPSKHDDAARDAQAKKWEEHVPKWKEGSPLREKESDYLARKTKKGKEEGSKSFEPKDLAKDKDFKEWARRRGEWDEDFEGLSRASASDWLQVAKDSVDLYKTDYLKDHPKGAK